MIDYRCINIELNDWLFNAGVVGFYNILKSYYDADDFNNFVKIENDSIKVDIKVFHNFSEKYFGYFIKNYIKFTPFGKILNFENQLLVWKDNILSFGEDDVKILNNMTSYAKEKLSRKSFENGYALIKDRSFDVLSKLKKLYFIKVKKSTDLNILTEYLNEQIDLMLEIINYLKKDNVKKILLSKEFTYSFTSDFLSNVSIWGRKNNSRDSYEVYEEYFVDPLISYFFSKKDKFNLYCITCGNPIVNKFQTDLTWIKGIGADTSKKLSHYYKFNSDIALCPICNLIYSCIPAGFFAFNGKGFFININSNFKELTTINKPLMNFLKNQDKITIQEEEIRNYISLCDGFQNDQNCEAFNVQIIKFDSSNEKRPFTFNLLNKRVAHLLLRCKPKLYSLIGSYIKIADKDHSYLFEEVLKKIFQHQNLYDLIGFCIKNFMQGRSKLVNASLIMDIQKSILIYKYEMLGVDMPLKVDVFIEHGMHLKEYYESIKKGNKIDFITYKLINILKANNPAKFIDVIINSYISIERNVPEDFLDVFSNNDNLKLLGFAFTLGLQLKKNKKDCEISLGGRN